MTEQSNKKTPQVAEIDISVLIEFVKTYFIRIVIIGIISGIAGYGASFLMTKTYTASTVILPESNASSGAFGSLSSLARLGGLSSNSSNNELSPELYPTILTTIPFALYMLEQPIMDITNKNYLNLQAYLNRMPKKVSSDAPDSRYNLKNTNADIITLTRQQEDDTKQVLESISSSFDFKSNTISISGETDDPFVTAQIVNYATNYLIKYITDYRTSKSLQEVNFLEEQSHSAKNREHKAEYALQSYRDRNRGSYLNVARIEEQRLQSEYTLAQSIYNDIVRKWEEAKIKVKEDHPVIKILKPVQVSFKTSKPRRLIIALATSTFALFIYFSIIFFQYLKMKSE